MYLYQNNTTKCNISQLILIVFYLYFMYNLYGDNMNSDNNNNPYVLWAFFIGYYMLYLIFGGLTSFLIGFSILILTILIIIIRSKIREKKAFQKLNFNFEYIREIPNYIDVNDIMFLNHTSFWNKKNIKLIIMQLYLKGVLEIKTENEKTIITKTDKKFMVSYAEKYICDYITSENKDNFNYVNYTNMVKKDVLIKDLAYDKNDLSLFKFYFLLSSLIFIIFTILYCWVYQWDLNRSIVLGFILLNFPSVFLSQIDKITKTLNLKFSDKGWAYKYIIKAYKKFLKDFTRMNELKNSDYHLWEKHLLFAQALNINLDYNNLPDINMNILDNKEK
ncbi:uncharacterized protein BN726_00397 [Clostridium sp. CAG:594]|nr:uncharacterized protein BN726_00397 [Clostridium sp. CAG:594]